MQGGTWQIVEGYSTFYRLNTASAPSAPIVTGVTPTPIPASNSPQTIEVLGSNFVSGDTLTFTDKEGDTFANRAGTFVSSTEIDYQFNDAGDAGNWTVQVNSSDGTQNSSPFTFPVAGNSSPGGADAGFDISAFPGMSVMDWLKANTNLTWVGYYLLAPDRTGASWLGTRSELVGDGWTIAPIYVGQQDTSIWTRTAAQGVIDADQAANEMGGGGEGFAAGTACYLDIENGLVSSSELTYANAWCSEITKDGFTPGIYAPGSDFTEMTSQYPSAQAALAWVADYQNSSYWPISGTTIFSDPGLTSQHENAAAWQYDVNPFNIATPFGTIGIDLDAVSASQVSCFAGGTRISTARGDVAIEDLTTADCVRAILSEGIAQIFWIGHRHVDCVRHPKPKQVWPVRISAGTFGPARPFCDLFLSPDHAVYIMEMLIPVNNLVNGTTIVQVPVDKVTYYHIELSQHDCTASQWVANRILSGHRRSFGLREWKRPGATIS